MPNFSMSQAKNNLSRILTLLELGEEIIISRHGKPIARVIPYATPSTKREFGVLKDKIKIDDSFFDELPEEELSCWNDQSTGNLQVLSRNEPPGHRNT